MESILKSKRFYVINNRSRDGAQHTLTAKFQNVYKMEDATNEMRWDRVEAMESYKNS